MKSFYAVLFATALFSVSTGCEPKPVVEENATPPAVDVNVDNRAAERETPPADTGVDVQIGGGQGVQVDVDREE